ncbi:hypothetical protein FKM82_014704 [Ascaphus truei]
MFSKIARLEAAFVRAVAHTACAFIDLDMFFWHRAHARRLYEHGLTQPTTPSLALLEHSFLLGLSCQQNEPYCLFQQFSNRGRTSPYIFINSYLTPRTFSITSVMKIQEKMQVSKADSPEGYYEEAEPYDASINGYVSSFADTGFQVGVHVSEGEIYATITMEDGEAVSSSYESYDEEETSKGKSTAHQHQWPSTEASIELMKDARICAFLWRKKWLGQWAKQLCVIRDSRLMCYKSSKDQNPQLDMNLIGCSVTHKEKQMRKKEHKLKITLTNADVIVLGMQSKDQAEQWLKVIQDVSGLQPEVLCDSALLAVDSQRQNLCKNEISDRCSAASESGSSTDGHPETPEIKEVKKKGTSGLKLSNLMNLGRKKSSSTESPEKSLETSNYLNVLIKSQWKSHYCCVKDGQLHFYQDRNKSKAVHQPVCLMGCEIIPQPSPDHLYSFRILHNKEELATLEAKSSEDMGHWLGLLLSESGSKTDPEEFSYDYVDADRVSCIVSAAKNSYLLSVRRWIGGAPNPYKWFCNPFKTDEHQ